jgi:transposase
MMKKPVTTKAPAEQVVKDIRRATRKLHSSEEKIRIVLSGLRGEDSTERVNDFETLVF